MDQRNIQGEVYKRFQYPQSNPRRYNILSRFLKNMSMSLLFPSKYPDTYTKSQVSLLVNQPSKQKS